MSAALSFRDVTLGYDRHPAVHHLTGAVAAGELLAVVGPNGAGKSTFLKGAVGEIEPFSGTVERNGAGTGEIAYLPQQAGLDRSFPLTVFDLVAMGHWRAVGAFAPLTGVCHACIEAALHRVGLEDFGARTVATLSRGQLQRALFARLLVQDAPLILLDEPFTALDRATEEALAAILRSWHVEGRTVVAVLHDLAQVRSLFPRTLLLARTAIAWGPTGEALARDNLATAGALAEAWDDDAPRCAPEEIAA